MAHGTRLMLLAGAAVSVALLAGCAVPTTSDGETRDRRERSAPPDDRNQQGHDGGGQGTAAENRVRGPLSTGWRVTRVVDGDTVDVSRGRRTLTLRLIGIDTPETVHPTEPVGCFGPEATEFASRQLLGAPVALEFDRSQGRTDYYGRTLAYVWLGSSMFNRAAVRRGYALEYTYDTPYAWQQEFRTAERRAREDDLGVWRCPRPGD